MVCVGRPQGEKPTAVSQQKVKEWKSLRVKE
jgi:hypothetical protein